MQTVTIPADLLDRLARAAVGRNDAGDDADIVAAFRAIHRAEARHASPPEVGGSLSDSTAAGPSSGSAVAEWA